MEIVNFNAIPMLPLDEDLAVSPLIQKRMKEGLKIYLTKHPPLCLVGSTDQVNRNITQIDLKTKLHKTSIHSNILAFEKLEAERKLKEQQRILGEKEKASKSKKKPRKVYRQTPFTLSTPRTGPRKRAPKNGLAELFHAPEFDESIPNELPNRVKYSDMVGNVVRAQGNTITGKAFCAPTEMNEFFASPYTKAIVLDCFWWIFHERYEPNQEIQKKLFNRVSKNYADLLLKTPRSPYKEAILRRFPSLLSQALYTSFCTCFPQSWFDNHEFKSSLCNTVTRWIGGTFATPRCYTRWDYFELEPVRFRREEFMRNKEKTAGSNRQKIAMQISKSEPRSKSQRQASKKVREITEMRALERLAPRESHPACKGPEFSKNLFGVTRSSPLIVHYLRQHNSHQQTGHDILLVRNDMTKMIPITEGTATYKDLIRQVKNNMKKLSKDSKYLCRVHWKEWKMFDQGQKDLQSEFIRKVREVNLRAIEKKKLNHEGLSDQPTKLVELHGKANTGSQLKAWSLP